MTLGGPSQAGDLAPSLTRGFLFADLRGYTSYVDEHGDHAAAQLLDRYRALVRAAVAGSRGAEIKTEGDSFYVVFDSASAAVRCGLAIIAAAAETARGAAEEAAEGGAPEAARGAAEGPVEPIHVGVGVHAGETVATAEGFVGSAVNIAARLCAQAKAGELVVSETVRALTRTYLDVDFEPLGTRRLKGVEEPVAIYRVTPRGAGVVRARARRAGGRRGRWLAGLGVVALVAVLGAAGAVVMQGGAQPSPTAAPSEAPTSVPASASASASTPASAAPSTAASPSGGPGGLTVAEQALKALIPPEFREECARSNVEKGAAGGSASLQCDLIGTTVWYDAFDESSKSQITVFMDDLVNRESLPLVKGDYDAILAACASGSGKAVGRWSLGRTFSGQLACYSKGGEAWIVWTYEGSSILAQAVRTDGNMKSLQDWWRNYAFYLQ